MNAKLIKTEADYEEALARLDVIFEAEPGTPKGDEAELLTALIEMYEEKTHPVGMPSPVEAIKFRMEQQGLKNKDLVPFLGSAPKVSEVLAGKRALSLSMIRNLVQGLDIPAEVLIGKPGAALKPDKEVAELRRYPLAEMVKRGWFTGFCGTLAEARGQLEDLFDRFHAVLGAKQMRLAFNRQHVRTGGRHDEHALAAWRVRAVTLASNDALPAYRQGTVTREFLTELARLSYLNDGPKLAREFLGKNGIHLVLVKHPARTHLDGAALKLPDGSPVVALTLRYDRLDNFWFTMFHELAHVGLHLDRDDIEAFYDDLTDASRDACETEADSFAQEALIPSKDWRASGLGKHATEAAVRELAARLRISPAIPAGRVRFERGDYAFLNALVGNGRVRRLFPEWPN